MHCTPSLQSFPNVAIETVETVPVFVWLMMAVSCPFKEYCVALCLFMLLSPEIDAVFCYFITLGYSLQRWFPVFFPCCWHVQGKKARKPVLCYFIVLGYNSQRWLPVFFSMLLMCSVTSSLWGQAHEDGFLSFFPCCWPAVHQLGSQGLGVRAGLPARQQHLAQRLPWWDAQAVGYRQLHAAGRDQGPLLPHQRHRHQLLTGLHSLQVSCWVGVGKAVCVLSVASVQVSCWVGASKTSCVVSVTRSGEVGVGKGL